MRKKICTEKCIYCKSSEFTVYKNKNQCYCKHCNKYFKPGSTRKEYSSMSALILNTIVRMVFPAFGAQQKSFRQFVKSVKDAPEPTYHNVKIKYLVVPEAKNVEDTAELNVEGNLKDSVVLTRTRDGFIVTRGLNVRQKIKFNDFNININASGNIKRDYSL